MRFTSGKYLIVCQGYNGSTSREVVIKEFETLHTLLVYIAKNYLVYLHSEDIKGATEREDIEYVRSLREDNGDGSDYLSIYRVSNNFRLSKNILE